MIVLGLVLALTGQIDVELSLTDGSTVSGQLEDFASSQVSIDNNGQRRAYALRQLRRVRFPSTEEVPLSPQEVTLTDGSRLAIDNFHCRGDAVTARRQNGTVPLSLTRRAVRAVKLGSLDAEQLQSWATISQNAPRSDVVVVRRKEGPLQPIEGILGDIDDAVIKFQYSGDWIDVRRERVAGVLFATIQGETQGIPRAELALNDGSQLQVLSLQREGNDVVVVTPSQVRLNIPFQQLRFVDFAALSMVALSDMEPELSEFTPYIQVPTLAEAEQQWFAPQHDRRITREPLVASVGDKEQQFDKGLGLHSRTRLIYRLAGKYRRFLATAAVDETGGAGQLTLLIVADNRELFRQEMSRGESAREIDVDISGANRLQIVVDYGNHGDQGDQMSLCDARLIK